MDAAVLTAALKLMAERGYERMSLEAVAEEAGVTKPTIYRRWSSKADLATAALAEMQAKEPPPETGRTWDDLTAILRNFQTSLFRPNGMAMIGTLLVQERETPDLIAAFRERILKPRRRMVRSLLQGGISKGDVDRATDLDAVVNLLIGAMYAKYLTGEPVPRDWPERIVGVLRRGIG